VTVRPFFWVTVVCSVLTKVLDRLPALLAVALKGCVERKETPFKLGGREREEVVVVVVVVEPMGPSPPIFIFAKRASNSA